MQGDSVIKPLVGASNDGPSDAAVVRPVLGSRRGLVVACGMNPRYGDFDTYHMAASAVDEAVRNCVAVGADPARIAILDNFCWGNTERPETLGSLVRAALACHDLALAWATPFISGKDSLNNEFRRTDEAGNAQSISIPPSLLISALGQVSDVATCVSMDLKEPGNLLFLVGQTKNELGGSHFTFVHGLEGGRVPQVDPSGAKRVFSAVHRAITSGLVRACHDLSEGGLAVAAAEMAFAGNLGARVDLSKVPSEADAAHDAVLLFSESNSRFLCEVPAAVQNDFVRLMGEVPHSQIGEVTQDKSLVIAGRSGQQVLAADVESLKKVWQAPLDW